MINIGYKYSFDETILPELDSFMLNKHGRPILLKFSVFRPVEFL